MKLEQRTIGQKVTSEAKLTNMTVSAEAVATYALIVDQIIPINI